MFTKVIFIAALAISCVCAKPGLAPLAYSAPLVAAAGPAYVTGQSSQVVGSAYNGVAAPLTYASAAGVAAPVAAPLAYTAPLAYSSPLAYTAAASPLAAAAYAAPFAAPYAAPYAAAYAASPYSAYRYNPYVL